jgi:hypothetical protein
MFAAGRGAPIPEIAAALKVSSSTIERTLAAAMMGDEQTGRLIAMIHEFDRDKKVEREHAIQAISKAVERLETL